MFLGDGTGNFGVATPYSVSFFYSYPSALAVADLNGDGFDDIVTANGDGGVSDYYPGTVSVLLADGAGGFAPSERFRVAPYPKDVAIEDFNADGNLDIATANTAFLNGEVSILLGDGAGNFDSAVNFLTEDANSFSQINVGDFDGDGLVDLVTSGSGNDVLSDSAGSNTLSGGCGDDTLIGSYGDNRMNGGSGADLFEFGYGSDTIVDFEDGTDKLQLSFGISFNDVFIEQNGSSTIVFDENQILATLVGVNATNVTIADFVV